MTATTYELTISRYFKAPPAAVYRAFTDPDQLAQWFGPLVFHTPRNSIDMDVRPGGHWKLTMVNNDNADWCSPVDSTFVEVVENQLLVGYQIAQGIPGMVDGTRMTLSLEFTAEGDGTRLLLRQGPFPEQSRELSEVGWTQSLFKLDALLNTPAKFLPTPTTSTPNS